jgi:hypothetical protein
MHTFTKVLRQSSMEKENRLDEYKLGARSCSDSLYFLLIVMWSIFTSTHPCCHDVLPKCLELGTHRQNPLKPWPIINCPSCVSLLSCAWATLPRGKCYVIPCLSRASRHAFIFKDSVYRHWCISSSYMRWILSPWLVSLQEGWKIGHWRKRPCVARGSIYECIHKPRNTRDTEKGPEIGWCCFSSCLRRKQPCQDVGLVLLASTTLKEYFCF